MRCGMRGRSRDNAGGKDLIELGEIFLEEGVALVGDHVSQVNYSGGLLSRGGQCAFAVQSCMQGLTDAPRS